VAQIPDDDLARVVVPYRAKPRQKAALDEVLTEESKGRAGKPRLTLSKVVEYVVGLGLDLYWVRHQTGRDLDALGQAEGWDRRRALLEVVKRGLRKK
jgi:hypothetical protein